MKPKFLRFPGGNFLEGPKITGAFPWKTNSITDREKIIPVTETIKGIKKSFSRKLDPYSVNIFELKTGK